MKTKTCRQHLSDFFFNVSLVFSFLMIGVMRLVFIAIGGLLFYLCITYLSQKVQVSASSLPEWERIFHLILMMFLCPIFGAFSFYKAFGRADDFFS